jgi:hypothetical protein
MSDTTTTKPTRKWYQKKRYIFSIVILLLFVFLIASAGGSGTSSSVVGNVSSQSDMKTDYKVGEVIENSGKQLTVTKVAPYNSGNPYSVPKAGKQWIQVSIEIKNNSSNEVSFNPYDFKVQDMNGVQLNPDPNSYSLADALSSGNLAPNGKIAGSLVFEIPTADQEAKLIYQATFWTNQRINVKLF